MQSHFKHFLADETASAAVEYAILVGLIAAAIIPASQLISSKISSQFNSLSNAFNRAGGPTSGFVPVRLP